MTVHRNASGRFIPATTIMVVVLLGYAIGLLLNPHWLPFQNIAVNRSFTVIQQVEPARQQIKFLGDFVGPLNEATLSSTGEYKMGESTDSIKTQIWQSQNGTLEGRYTVIASEGYNFTGRLEQDGTPNNNEVSFKWHDRYGTGQLKLSFDDSKGFQGKWKSDELNSTWRRWDGQRDMRLWGVRRAEVN